MVGGVHDQEIRSVAVPVFTSDDFRRGYEFELTEAVQKQIQNQSHFRLAKEPYADTRLRGHIVEIRKDRLSETGFDEPRELMLDYAVEVSWEDVRSGRILAEQVIPIERDVVAVVSRASFAPEVGQSLATGKHEATQRMARQIVEMMEMPW